MPFLRERFLNSDASGNLVLLGVGLCLVLGGGVLVAPGVDMVLQVAIAMVVATWFWIAPGGLLRAIPPLAWVMAALIVLIPALQLVPLPPSFWHGLPGRDIERDALALIGQENSWRPLSITPDRTLSGLMSAICVAIFLPLTASLSRGGRSRLMVVVVAGGLLSVLAGMGQLAGNGTGPFQFYENSNYIMSGLQWNRNSDADVLLIAMVASAGVALELARLTGMERRGLFLLGFTAGCSLPLAVTTVLTASRTGMAMLLPVVGIQLFMLRGMLRGSLRGGRGMWLALLVVVALLALGGVLASRSSAVSAAFDRVQQMHTDLRPAIWATSLDLAHQSLPWGLGIGAYAPAFARVEPLAIVNPLYVAFAYQDYLQFAIEGGLPGLLLAVMAVVVVIGAVVRGFAVPAQGSRGQYLFAISVLGIIAAHAVWDYPLHSTTLACLAACSVGMLLPRRYEGRAPR